MTAKKRNWFFWLKRILLLVFLVQLMYILLTKWVDPPITITQITNAFEGEGLQRDYIEYDAMSPYIKLAVMASEDQLFPDHNGFDIKSIKKAMKYNERHPNRVRGASTISQQTAKNVFLWQKGGFFRKGLEVYFTWMIELIWGKKRILETYLNVAEMGPGIFGVQAASRAYFNKDASKLTRREAAQIAACLPNPKRFIVSPPGKYVIRRTGKILQQMNNLEGDLDVRALVYNK
jgi:monofunctional biosynthetic peptidoglycan transglycosylase